MTKFKTVIVAIAIVAFLGYCVWLSPNLFGNRIKSEMVADSLLKYDQGAGVYLASKNDSSKVFFGQSGKYRFYGTGALTLKASPKEDATSFGSGFNLLIEGGDLELKAGQADILTGSVSPNGQFLALMNINGILSIYEISTGKKTYESKEIFINTDPIKGGPIEYPGFFWTDQGLIAHKPIGSKTDGYRQLFPWQKSAPAWGKNISVSEIKNISQLVSVEPATGNINDLPNEDPEKKYSNVIGKIDSENLLIFFSSINDNNISSNIGKLNVLTSEISKSNILQTINLGYHNNNLFYIKDGTIVYTKITAKSASTPVAVNLPELDGEKLTPELIENLRVTSRGYLYFRHIKTAKTYLLEPITGVYVEIPKERYPY